MAFATVEDVEAALGRGLGTTISEDTVTYLLDAASDLVIGYMNWSTIPDPPTDNVKRVTAEMVANVLNRPQTPPDVQDAYNPGGFAYHVGPTSVGPWLTAAQKTRLNKDGSGVRTLDLASEIIGSDLSTSIAQTADPYAGTDMDL